MVCPGASPIGFDVELRGEQGYNHGAVTESCYKKIGDRRWARFVALNHGKNVYSLGWRTCNFYDA